MGGKKKKKRFNYKTTKHNNQKNPTLIITRKGKTSSECTFSLPQAHG